MYRRFGKRIIDILISATALLLLWPVIVVVGLLVRVKLGSPVIFCQQRPGLQCAGFLLYKFRSMTDQRDTQGELLPDAVRLTRFGRLLRASSLDELPELWNILHGDMSLVGPRPLLMQYLPLYNATQQRRHEVRPGLTGLAQVNGRNAISWPERLALDVRYVDEVTFLLDVKIMLSTIHKLFVREGISSATSATMEVFTGNGGDDT